MHLYGSEKQMVSIFNVKLCKQFTHFTGQLPILDFYIARF
uniref:Uncharacterized protein n=1 Tax=Rhizophora mucronata TaxID=61149 RepID=A0A2P2JHF6_RHIMU